MQRLSPSPRRIDLPHTQCMPTPGHRCTFRPHMLCTRLLSLQCRCCCASYPQHSSCRSPAPRSPDTSRPRTQCIYPHCLSPRLHCICQPHMRCTHASRPQTGTDPHHSRCSPARPPCCTFPPRISSCMCRRRGRNSLLGSHCTRWRSGRCAYRPRRASMSWPTRRCSDPLCSCCMQLLLSMPGTFRLRMHHRRLYQSRFASCRRRRLCRPSVQSHQHTFRLHKQCMYRHSRLSRTCPPRMQYTSSRQARSLCS